ncbi:unnamed protein product [Adineta ricciae]|uniref:Uncharacterized protein n=1 Tax=Adineta ricciae TaxID=249248 RepID=A0A815PLY1_ADIRI|nr:unnamed protein product [Adineta ricciae]
MQILISSITRVQSKIMLWTSRTTQDFILKCFLVCRKYCFLLLLIVLIILKMLKISIFDDQLILNDLVSRLNMSNVLMKLKSPFKCYNDDESVFLKDFYRLDCENPFLKNISLRDLNNSMDVCELFNEPYDSNKGLTLYSRIKMDFKNFQENITHSDIMKMEAACPECHHIQIIDGQLFIVNRRTAVNFQFRSRKMKSLLKQVVDTFQSIRNLEMFIHVQDAVMLNSSELNEKKHKVPVFGFA